MTGIYWERGLEMPRATECELVELDAQLIPAMLSAIAGRMGPSHWESREAWLEGYKRLSQQGAALLMGCKQDLITEIRALRDSSPTHAVYDLDVYPPGTWPGADLRLLADLLYAAPNSTAELLTQIRDLLAQSGEASEAQLELLGQLVLLLGV